MSGVRPGPHRQDLWVGLHGTNQVGFLHWWLCMHYSRQVAVSAWC